MTHTDYTTEALKTWTAPLRNTPDGIAYLQLGLLPEVGECYGVLKRILRDKTPMDRAQERFEDELGDVLWYWTVLQWEQAQGNGDPSNRTGMNDWYWSVIIETTCAAARTAGLDVDHGRARAANIAKLRDRAVRGVITGEGGSR